ncbi:MAG: long-chain fatty acid--CoA ligase [Gemmatimonadales bacterium]|jgi:long-chain acyl-CoA synthetase|nr:MAG: long-chain fatty acid--CoA ligase [Gemmatimonadales bacterium]
MESSKYASNPAEIEQGTLPSLLLAAVDRFGSAPALRNFVGETDEVTDLSYDDMLEVVTQGAAGLRALGLEPGDRAAILSENRTEWALADQSCLFSRVIDVPIYDTLIAEQVAYILNDSGARLVFASTRDQADKVLESRSALEVDVQVVVFEPGKDRLPEGVLSWREFLERGAEQGWGRPEMEREAAATDPDDVATILYTSGTTGDPKGVMLTHQNIFSNTEAAGRVLPIFPGDVTLSFLPLSHIFQRMVDYLLLSRGCTLARAHDVTSVARDLGLVKPTIQIAVPRVYEKVFNAVREAARGVKKGILAWAEEVGNRWADARLQNRSPGLLTRAQYRIADRLVFSKLRERLGNRVRFFISGSAPLAEDVNRFFYAAGLPILEGYGLTETSPVTNVNPPDGVRIGTVGPPAPGTEVRIADDGEILVRGPQVMKGYYNRPEATAAVIDEEGWFATGDIGELDEDGYLRITDRKKDLLVTAGGKNVAPQPVENRLKTNRFVEQVVMVGDRRKFCSLLVVPSFDALRRWARDQGLPHGDHATLLALREVQDLLEREILGHLGPLARYERPKKFALLDREFTVEDGSLTPTLKVKRRVVQERFREVIDRMYEEENEDQTVFVA